MLDLSHFCNLLTGSSAIGGSQDGAKTENTCVIKECWVECVARGSSGGSYERSEHRDSEHPSQWAAEEG